MLPIHSLLFAATVSTSPASASADVIWSEATAGESSLPVPRQIYLNRCEDGCTVEPGSSDSLADTSSLITDTSYLRSPGLHGAKWEQIVDCVADAFAAYEVEVTENEPTGQHLELMFGLHPIDMIGLEIQAAGVAPTACHPLRSGLAFAFHYDEGLSPQTLCRIATHELGHVIGLDHTMECADPMSYLAPCTDSVAFADLDAECGESEARECACGGERQNSHQAVLNFFGPHGAPQIEILEPAPLSRVRGPVLVRVDVLDEDPIERVEIAVEGAPELDQVARGEPFEFELNLPAGRAELTIRARDGAGMESEVVLALEVEEAEDAPEETSPRAGSGATEDPEGGVAAGCTAAGAGTSGLGAVLLALLGFVSLRQRGARRTARSLIRRSTRGAARSRRSMPDRFGTPSRDPARR